MGYKTHTIDLSEGQIMLSTGKVAWLAAGSVTVTMGGTVILANVSIDPKETEQDFFPLSVEYIEKLYAGGTISGSRFLKREGFPADQAVIKARQVDHTIRPLFPKGFRRPVSVVLTVLAYDGKNDPESLTVTAASAALMISGLPFDGPVASAVVGLDAEGNLLVNPNVEQEEKLEALFAISGSDGKLLNIEGWGKQVSEDTMGKLIDMAMERIRLLIQEQKVFAQDITKPQMQYAASPVDEGILRVVDEKKGSEIKQAIYLGKTQEANGRQDQLRSIKESLESELAGEGDMYSAFAIDSAVEYLARKYMRQGVLQENKRLSGRAMDEIRELKAEVDVLPTVHGSALFSRGLTQCLSIVTLGSTKMNQLIDGMEGEEEKGFMHHYNMPPFATGEAGRYQYKPGRREIGHGAIGENALRNVIPTEDEFPYTIRVVSEVMSSNGSTSMAATCAASMALMAAGVPVVEAVAGIGVGLITDDEDPTNYRLLLDIEGVEDFYGDMDFKVTGTQKGITAIQFETKLHGVDPVVIKEAFQLAKDGRLQVLQAMNSAISQARTQLAATAPRVKVVNIPVDKIGELIGPGGKNIKGIVEEAEKLSHQRVDIEINDDGRVVITAFTPAQMEYALAKVQEVSAVPELGKVYTGTIDKVMPYGAFVDVTSSISGLIHVSELSDGFVKDPAEIVKEGQEVKVKLIKIENGRLSFSMKLDEASKQG